MDARTPSVPAPKRFQFSLRRLLIVTAMLSLVIGVGVRFWYVERAKAMTSHLRRAELTEFLVYQFRANQAQKRKDIGQDLDFGAENGIVESGQRNYDWDLTFRCSQFVSSQAQNYVAAKFYYTAAGPNEGSLRVVFGSEGTENADFEKKLRTYLDGIGCPYEIEH